MASRGCVCFVGNLPGDVREREIEDLFYKYGRIRNIDLKLPPRPPAFAFVEFENPRDAEDAVRGRDGYDFDGNSIRVELSRGGMGSRSREGGGGNRDVGYGGGGDFGRRGGGGPGFGRGPPPVAPPNFRAKGSAHRVMVKGLPMSASWQDLKDHFRKVCTPNYVNVFRDRGGVIGVVEFDTPEDLARAIRKLDDTEFRNPFERAYIRVYDDSDSKRGGGRSRSRSVSSRSRSRSSRSRSYSRSRSGSRSRSASRSRSRSRSRSKSRSASPRSDKGDADKEPEKDDADKADKEPEKEDEPMAAADDKEKEPEAANGAADAHPDEDD